MAPAGPMHLQGIVRLPLPDGIAPAQQLGIQGGYVCFKADRSLSQGPCQELFQGAVHGAGTHQSSPQGPVVGIRQGLLEVRRPETLCRLVPVHPGQIQEGVRLIACGRALFLSGTADQGMVGNPVFPLVRDDAEETVHPVPLLQIPGSEAPGEGAGSAAESGLGAFHADASRMDHALEGPSLIVAHSNKAVGHAPLVDGYIQFFSRKYQSGHKNNPLGKCVPRGLYHNITKL